MGGSSRIPDFDRDIHTRIQQAVSRLAGDAPTADFVFAWRAVRYRFWACALHDEQFTRLFHRFGDGPKDHARYHQDRELHEFFFTGLSVIESYCYSLYALGAILDPREFQLSTVAQRKRVTPKFVLDSCTDAWSQESVTSALKLIIQSSEYREWADLRNLLSHRVMPGRNILLSVGSPPSEPSSYLTKDHIESGINLELSVRTTAGRREWLSKSVHLLMVETQEFLKKRAGGK